MNSTKLFFYGLIVVSMFCAELNAQGLRIPFVSNKKTTADSVQLTQKAGPWLIMCASFSGENGQQQAFRLAQELRETHRLQAYVYQHRFDVAREVQGKGLGFEVFKDEEQRERVRPKQMKLAGEESVEEIAVLVGDFSSLEDAAAQRTLAGIKAVHPRTMAEYDTDPTNKTRGPLRAAFMMPNPMLPEQYFEARQIDGAVLKWNSKTKHSLLKNPGNYSIRIATFDGDSTFKLDEIQETKARDSWMQKNRKAITDSKLVNAAKKATVLTAALRQQGIEAYEFHDRHESYVCVGGYQWIVEEDSKGNKRNNPEAVAVIKKFKGEMLKDRKGQTVMRTYKLPDKLVQAGISCDVQPIPVLIPKAPASHTATKKRLFGRYSR